MSIFDRDVPQTARSFNPPPERPAETCTHGMDIGAYCSLCAVEHPEWPAYGHAGRPYPDKAPVIRLLTTLTSEQRKEYPIVTGVLDYFPDAIAMVAHVSYLGNKKHNPGQPMHHARGKSADHMDCLGRHIIERDQIETDNIRHLANAAWRTLAELQVALEKEFKLSLPRGAKE